MDFIIFDWPKWYEPLHRFFNQFWEKRWPLQKCVPNEFECVIHFHLFCVFFFILKGSQSYFWCRLKWASYANSKQHTEVLKVKCKCRNRPDVCGSKSGTCAIRTRSCNGGDNFSFTKLNSKHVEVLWPKWEYSSSNWAAQSPDERRDRINSRRRSHAHYPLCDNFSIWASLRLSPDRWKPNRKSWFCLKL